MTWLLIGFLGFNCMVCRNQRPTSSRAPQAISPPCHRSRRIPESEMSLIANPGCSLRSAINSRLRWVLLDGHGQEAAGAGRPRQRWHLKVRRAALTPAWRPGVFGDPMAERCSTLFQCTAQPLVDVVIRLKSHVSLFGAWAQETGMEKTTKERHRPRGRGF